MKTDKQIIKLEKDFRAYIKSQHGEMWKKYSGSVLEGTVVNFIRQILGVKYEEFVKLETQNKDLTKALEAIRALTSDEQSSLMKALHEIAHKALKI